MVLDLVSQGLKGPLGPKGAQGPKGPKEVQDTNCVLNLGFKSGPQGPNLTPGVKIWPWRLKISKFRTEKTCRTHRSTFQTEPYVATHGRNRF